MGLSLLARATKAAGGPEALLAQIGEAALAEVLRAWEAIARPEQLPPPGNWSTWIALAGRGWGKTRVGAEFITGEITAGRMTRVALVAPTAADARDVMVEGESGLLAISRDDFRPKYEPSKRRLTWPNGAIATMYSAEEPDRLRGPQHDGFWCDEIAAWWEPEAAWNMLMFGLRLGRHPRGVVTTTPRPIPLVRQLLMEPTTVAVRGTTYDNAANLAPSFLEAIRRQYEGTRLGRQEIHAEILDDNPGALWKMATIEASRVRVAPELRRVAIGIDPAVSHQEDSDETGIIAAGIAPCRCKGVEEIHGFVLDDVSGIFTPAEWAAAAIGAHARHSADALIPEVNQGGDLVEANIRANGGGHVRVKPVHAARGKHTRAEPIAALYEQGKVHHVGVHSKLEDQMTQWNPLTDARSPDRMDALVHVLTELMLGPQFTPYQRPAGTRVGRRI